MAELKGVVGVTGANAAGKGEVIKILEELGFKAQSLSDILREEARARGEEPVRDVLIALGRELRGAHGPGVLAQKLVGRLQDGWAVDSIRHPQEVNTLRSLSLFTLVGVEADPEVRFQRMTSRARKGDAITWEAFLAMEEKEKGGSKEAQDLPGCLAMADVTLTNNGDLDSLRDLVLTTLAQRGHRAE